jgi:hypothetical protein
MGQVEIGNEGSVPDQEPDAPSFEICALSPVPCSDPRYEEIREGVLAAQAESLEEELAVEMR